MADWDENEAFYLQNPQQYLEDLAIEFRTNFIAAEKRKQQENQQFSRKSIKPVFGAKRKNDQRTGQGFNIIHYNENIKVQRSHPTEFTMTDST